MEYQQRCSSFLRKYTVVPSWIVSKLYISAINNLVQVGTHTKNVTRRHKMTPRWHHKWLQMVSVWRQSRRRVSYSMLRSIIKIQNFVDNIASIVNHKHQGCSLPLLYSSGSRLTIFLMDIVPNWLEFMSVTLEHIIRTRIYYTPEVFFFYFQISMAFFEPRYQATNQCIQNSTWVITALACS